MCGSGIFVYCIYIYTYVYQQRAYYTYTCIYIYFRLSVGFSVKVLGYFMFILASAYFAHSYTVAIASRMLPHRSATAIPRVHCPSRGNRDAVGHMGRAQV